MWNHHANYQSGFNENISCLLLVIVAEIIDLASINLSAFVRGGRFDYVGLGRMAKLAAMNVDAIIDTGYYPTEKAKRTNQTSRPIAVRIMGYSFTSPEAREMNKRIMATI